MNMIDCGEVSCEYCSKDKCIYMTDKIAVLDKIISEIEQLKLHKAQFLTNDNKVCIDSQDVLNVIDKYKAEGAKMEVEE